MTCQQPLKDLAASFFSLPHIRTTHDGVENHYHFSISPAAYAEPNDDIIQIVKVGDNFTHIGGPMKLRMLPLQKRVDTVLRFLFASFIDGLPTELNDEIQHVIRQLGAFAKFSACMQTSTTTAGAGKNCSTAPRLVRRPTLSVDRRMAPSSWSTDDAALARAMSNRLRELAGSTYGNHPLVDIRNADERDNRAAMITYIAFQHSLIRGIKKHTTDVLRDANGFSSQCNGDSGPITPVTSAGRTLVTGPIEEEDEEDGQVTGNGDRHLKPEGSVVNNPDPDGEFPDPSTYYNTKAHRVQEASNLAASINLVLPGRDDCGTEPVSIIIPLRRLIITANDTSHNLNLLLGPRFHSSASAQSLYTSTRIKTALIPPVGSTLYNFFYPLDRGCPYRCPGPPSPNERTMCNQVYALLHFMKRKLGIVGRKVREDEVSEMMEMWLKEGKGVVEMDVWKMAVGCLDQGLQVEAA